MSITHHHHLRVVLLLTLLSSALMLIDLGLRSLWIDELATVNVITQSPLASVINMVGMTEGRPPLYYILVHGWIGLVGQSDFSLRYPSVFFAILCLPVFYALSRRLTNSQTALLATAFFACAPLMLLYGRMARAYYMAVFLALLSTLFFIRMLRTDKRADWMAWLCTSIILLYTDYTTASILAVHNLCVFLFWKQHRKILRRWIACQIALAASFLPWIPVLLNQTGRYQNQQSADLSSGILGYLVKLAQPALVFSVGETTLPVDPLVAVCLMVILGLAGYAVFNIARRHNINYILALLGAVIPVLFTVFIITGWLVKFMTFAWIGARSLHALPFYLLLVALGLMTIPRHLWRAILVIPIAIVFVMADANYYAGKEFHNPAYLIPAKDIVAQVFSGAQPYDIIVAAEDSGFSYYYSQLGSPLYPLFGSFDADPAVLYIQKYHSPRVWLISVNRDRGRALQPVQLQILLDEAYTLADRWGYVELSPAYMRFKEALTGRDAYPYKAELFLYTRR